MKERHSEISRISWLFSACVEQYRYLGLDNKKTSKIPNFFHSVGFNQYVKHFHLSINLLKQAEKLWSLAIETNRLNRNSLHNIYLIYFKRSIFQFQLSQDDLKQMIYEGQFQNDMIYQSLRKKGHNLLSLMGQLDQALYQFQQYSV